MIIRVLILLIDKYLLDIINYSYDDPTNWNIIYQNGCCVLSELHSELG